MKRRKKSCKAEQNFWVITMGNYAPRATDFIMESTMIEIQKADEPAEDRGKLESLWEPNDARLKERGGYDGHVSESSLYTQASLHPVITGSALALGVGGLLYALAKGYSASSYSRADH